MPGGREVGTAIGGATSCRTTEARPDYVGWARDSVYIEDSGFISAFGSFFACTVALVIAGCGAIRERRRRPSLFLSFDQADPYDYMPGVRTTAWTESHWVRLRVESAGGKRSADEVEVLVVEVRGGWSDGRSGGPPLGGFSLGLVGHATG